MADAGPPLDAGAPDAGAPDAGAPDASAPDAGVPDAGVPVDAGVDPIACVTDATCGSGMRCHPVLGACVVACNEACAEYSQRVCDLATRVCSCVTDALCATQGNEATICSPVSHRCVKPCSQNSDCSSGSCNTTIGECRPLPLQTWRQVMVGQRSVYDLILGEFAFALRADRTLWARGNNLNGMLGIGSTSDATTFTRVGQSADWDLISAGSGHTLALKVDGSLWAWGRNLEGQVGDGTQLNRNTPTPIMPGTRWLSVSAGDIHSLAIRDDGTLWAWGANTRGRLGDGTMMRRTSPVQISAAQWRSISAAGNCSFAIDSSDNLFAWGSYLAYLGFSHQNDVLVPTLVGSGYAEVSAGSYHVVARKTDGTLWTWGNGDGVLGDGQRARIVPAQVGTAVWGHVVAGPSSGFALSSGPGASELWSWGRYSLGTSAGFVEQPLLTKVSGTGWVDVSAGTMTGMGIRADGSLWEWTNGAPYSRTIP
jgi:hypothetical protein